MHYGKHDAVEPYTKTCSGMLHLHIEEVRLDPCRAIFSSQTNENVNVKNLNALILFSLLHLTFSFV